MEILEYVEHAVLKVYIFVYDSFAEATNPINMIISLIVLIFLFAVIYAILSEILVLSLTYIPILSRNPPLFPSSRKYQVKMGSHDIAYDFQWQYPYIVVDGARYNMAQASRQSREPILMMLPTGTTVLFQEKEEEDEDEEE